MIIILIMGMGEIVHALLNQGITEIVIVHQLDHSEGMEFMLLLKNVMMVILTMEMVEAAHEL